MPALDFTHATLAKHLSFAEDHYEREFSTPDLLRALKQRGVDPDTAQAIAKEVKRRRRGPARKAAAVKFFSGIGLMALCAVLLIGTGYLYWYIGGAGIVMTLMGAMQFVFGVGDRN